ncbi:MAG: lysine-sensitive aspartokinase 3 [Pantoea sp. Brub]|nr:lysine-sensitive aspartokinase 3 [Pantoea sp. Brub]
MREKLIVAKFGGTSVANFDSMNSSADIIFNNNNIRLVVLSASANVTNLLVSLSNVQDKLKRNILIKKIKYIQYDIINKLAQPSNIRKLIDIIINKIFNLSKLNTIINSNKLKDKIISYGELMSTLLFVQILCEREITAIWFDVRKVMYTNNNFGCAKPNIRLILNYTKLYLNPIIMKNIIVTQGFIGRNNDGHTTTLGRGGSDYTATLLGEALKADRIDIWTDVSGIYTTDPRIVSNAKKINTITFAEAAEMANFGAKILHPATLIPAMRSNIPVFVGSSKKPLDTGTLIYNKITNLPLFRALALRHKQTLLTLYNCKLLHKTSFLLKLFNIFIEHNISIDLVTISEMSISITFNTMMDNLVNKKIIQNVLLNQLASYCTIKIEENLSLIAIIGNKLSTACGLGQEIFSVLKLFNIRMICHGASNYNLCLLVSDMDAENVVRILHKHLFD